MSKNRKQEEKKLRGELYRPRSHGELSALRRSRVQSFVTGMLILILIAAAVIGILIARRPKPEETPKGPTESSVEPTVYVVYLDPGHGGEDYGTPIDEEHSESDLVMACALDIKKLLEADGVSVILSRGTDPEKIPESEAERVAACSGASCAISIHTCRDKKASIYSLVSDSTGFSEALAKRLGHPANTSDPSFPRPAGVPWVRLDTTPDELNAQNIAQAILLFLKEDLV